MSRQGAYIVLKREDLKQLQAQQGDEAVRAFASALRQSKTYRNEGLILDCGTCWDPIHRCLTEGTLDPNAGEFPLSQFVLGGKRLHRGGGFEAVLVRPDIVPHVAEATRDIKRAEFQQKYYQLDPQDYGQPPHEKELDKVWSVFRQVQQLFDDAAADRAAVLFTVER